MAAGYRGTVTFASSDANASLPSSYTFGASDAGRRRFAGGVVLRTSGAQRVGVTDAVALSANQNGLVVGATDYSYYFVANIGLQGQLLQNPNPGVAGTQLNTGVRSGKFGQVLAFGTDATVRLQNLCMGVSGPVGPAAAITMDACDGSAGQQWAQQSNRLVSLRDPNYCLASSLMGSPSGATLMPCHQALSQQYLLFGNTPAYNVTAPSIASCMAVSGYVSLTGVPLLGSAVTLGACKTSADQTFFYDQSGTLQQSGQCIDFVGSATSQNAGLVTASCSGAAWQKWLAVGATLRPAVNPNYCLDLHYDLLNTNPELATCNGGATQQVLTVAQAAFHDLMLASTATTSLMCLAANANAAGGPVVQARSCGPIEASTYSAAVPAFNATALSPTYDSSQAWGAASSNSGGNISIANLSWLQLQGFVPAYTVDGSVKINSLLLSGLCVDAGAASAGTNATLTNCSSSPSQTFYRPPHTYMMQPLQNPNVCLEVQDGVPSAGTAVVYNGCNERRTGQRLGMMPVYVGTLLGIGNSRNAFVLTHGSRCVMAAGNNIAAGSNLVLGDCTYSASTQLMWQMGAGNRLQALGTGNLCLDANNPSAGSVAKLATCSGTSSQQFTMW